MHKGTKLGKRDQWQININYCQRQAEGYYLRMQGSKKELAGIDPTNEEDIKEIENNIAHYEKKYRQCLANVQYYTDRKKYALKNLAFIAPYLEKYGERAGFVYLFKTLDEKPLYKIGKSRNLLSRTQTYNSGYSGAIKNHYEYFFIFPTEEAELVERLLVEIFKDKRVKGKEWFDLSAQDISRIKKIFKWHLENR